MAARVDYRVRADTLPSEFTNGPYALVPDWDKVVMRRTHFAFITVLGFIALGFGTTACGSSDKESSGTTAPTKDTTTTEMAGDDTAVEEDSDEQEDDTSDASSGQPAVATEGWEQYCETTDSYVRFASGGLTTDTIEEFQAMLADLVDYAPDEISDSVEIFSNALDDAVTAAPSGGDAFDAALEEVYAANPEVEPAMNDIGEATYTNCPGPGVD